MLRFCAHLNLSFKSNAAANVRKATPIDMTNAPISPKRPITNA
jgi:hypothetical protein